MKVKESINEKGATSDESKDVSEVCNLPSDKLYEVIKILFKSVYINY